MTKKRRKRRPAATDDSAASGDRQTIPVAKGFGAPSVFPPLGPTLARGFAAVTIPPVLLALPLLIVLGVWLALLALGVELFRPQMAYALGIPPLGSAFDLSATRDIFGLSAIGILGILGFTLVRAIVWAVLVGMVDEALEYRSVSMVGVLRGLRAFWAVLFYDYVSVGILLFGNVILPSLLGPTSLLFVQAVLVGGLFFFTFAPIAAVRLGLSARESISRSVRAARLPGWPRHLLMAVLYFFLFWYAAGLIVPNPGDLIATPSLAMWVYVLVATYVHMGFLGGFAYRWRQVEDLVPEQAARRRPRRA
ncbi:MAG: hypothetical protein WD276_05300 [Actinomycetota bacterium]